MESLDIKSLFAGSPNGACYGSISALYAAGGLFQDDAGTVSAKVDGPVGRINDLSGNDFDMKQSEEARKPILRESGGFMWLQFDGVDDVLTHSAQILQIADHEIIAAIRTPDLPQAASVLYGEDDSAGSASGALIQLGLQQEEQLAYVIRADSGGVLFLVLPQGYQDKSHIVGARFSTDSVARLFVDGNEQASSVVSPKGAGATGIASLGAVTSTPGNFSAYFVGRLYGFICRSPAFSPSERNRILDYFRQEANV